MIDASDNVMIRSEFEKADPVIACNIWGLIKELLIKMELLEAEVNAIKGV